MTVGNGTVQATPSQPLYTLGQVVTLEAFPDPRWSFTSWSGALSGTINPSQLTMNGDVAARSVRVGWSEMKPLRSALPRLFDLRIAH